MLKTSAIAEKIAKQDFTRKWSSKNLYEKITREGFAPLAARPDEQHTVLFSLPTDNVAYPSFFKANNLPDGKFLFSMAVMIAAILVSAAARVMRRAYLTTHQ